MHILAVVQRYGAGITGGAEQSCAELSERLVRRGHSVEILTTDAITYGDWQPGLPTGSSRSSGVDIVRLPVRTRMVRRFCKDTSNAATSIMSPKSSLIGARTAQTPPSSM